MELFRRGLILPGPCLRDMAFMHRVHSIVRSLHLSVARFGYYLRKKPGVDPSVGEGDAMHLNVNGKDVEVSESIQPGMPLLWFLRDELGLTGTKYACGNDICGACTVLINGRNVKSCQITVAEAQGRDIITIEGQDDTIACALFAAWKALDVAQCGFCQPGQIASAVALLRVSPAPDDADIDAAMIGNLCRCATYQRIRQAIHRAAAELQQADVI